VLLPSGPDTVRDSPLRGTRSSTPPGAAASGREGLEEEFSPAGADCRYRAPLVPRLARPTKDTPRRADRRASRPSGRSVGPASRPRPNRTGCWFSVRLDVNPTVARAMTCGSPMRATPSARTEDGGEGGIRTLDALPRTAFPVRRHSPLGDLSARSAIVPLRPGCRRRSPACRRSSERRSASRPTVAAERPVPGEHPTARAQTPVREGASPHRRDQPSVRPERGGEGGIRTHGAFAHRFSRAAPSTTRTPLRGGGYQRVRLVPRGRPALAPGSPRLRPGSARVGAPGWVPPGWMPGWVGPAVGAAVGAAVFGPLGAAVAWLLTDSRRPGVRR
jgi:hypothetical protein